MKTVQVKHISDKEIIDACNAFHKSGCTGVTPDVALSAKYPVKVILAKMDQMVRRGVLDYGVSLRTAWVERRPVSNP